MSVVNERVPKLIPVECNFFWPQSALLTFTVEGHAYPYAHQADEVIRASDSRYAYYTNFINAPLTFDAVDSEELGHPKTVTPPGVSIIEYLWDFGDGISGQGPVVSHTYKAVGAETKVRLLVTDTRGLRYSCSKPLNLVYAGFGSSAANKLRS